MVKQPMRKLAWVGLLQSLLGCALVGYDPVQPPAPEEAGTFVSPTAEDAGRNTPDNDNSTGDDEDDEDDKTDGGKGNAGNKGNNGSKNDAGVAADKGNDRPQDAAVDDADTDAQQADGALPESQDAAVPMFDDAGSSTDPSDNGCSPGEIHCDSATAYRCADDRQWLMEDCAAGADACHAARCDPLQGCVYNALNETPCDDDDPCTDNDACRAGTCSGQALDCSSLDQACALGVCSAGQCIAEPVEEGFACGTELSCMGGICVTIKDCAGTASCFTRCNDPSANCGLSCAGAVYCELACTGASCAQDCVGTSHCVGTCDSATACAIDCAGTSWCEATCAGTSACNINCQGATRCDPVVCRGSSQCTVDCTAASQCDVTCDELASCTLRCAPATSCAFSFCNGVQEDCGDGVVVCNGRCP